MFHQKTTDLFRLEAEKEYWGKKYQLEQPQKTLKHPRKRVEENP